MTGGERKRLQEKKERLQGGWREEEPRGGLPDLLSSPAYQPQMLPPSAPGDLNSPAIYKV